MMVAGLGFRADAPLSSLREALELALERARVHTLEQGRDQLLAQSCPEAPASPILHALASAPSKALAPALQDLAQALGLAVIAAPVTGIPTPTQSARVQTAFGTGSVAEASALSALGPNARLIVTRVQSRDGMATAAIAWKDSE